MHSRSWAVSHSRERARWGSAISPEAGPEFSRRPPPARRSQSFEWVHAYPQVVLSSVSATALTRRHAAPARIAGRSVSATGNCCIHVPNLPKRASLAKISAWNFAPCRMPICRSSPR